MAVELPPSDGGVVDGCEGGSQMQPVAVAAVAHMVHRIALEDSRTEQSGFRLLAIDD